MTDKLNNLVNEQNVSQEKINETYSFLISSIKEKSVATVNEQNEDEKVLDKENPADDGDQDVNKGEKASEKSQPNEEENHIKEVEHD